MQVVTIPTHTPCTTTLFPKRWSSTHPRFQLILNIPHPTTTPTSLTRFISQNLLALDRSTLLPLTYTNITHPTNESITNEIHEHRYHSSSASNIDTIVTNLRNRIAINSHTLESLPPLSREFISSLKNSCTWLASYVPHSFHPPKKTIRRLQATATACTPKRWVRVSPQLLLQTTPLLPRTQKNPNRFRFLSHRPALAACPPSGP